MAACHLITTSTLHALLNRGDARSKEACPAQPRSRHEPSFSQIREHASPAPLQKYHKKKTNGGDQHMPVWCGQRANKSTAGKRAVEGPRAPCPPP